MEFLDWRTKRKRTTRGFEIGDQFTAHAENFLRPIECEILKLYQNSALVKITKTVGKTDQATCVELNGKTIVSCRNFLYELSSK